jgi:hypothetical protein
VPEPPTATIFDPEVELRQQGPYVDADLDAPLYTEAEAQEVMPHFQKVRYGSAVEVAPGITATFLDAGHILGSAIIRLEVRETDGGQPTTIIFSGDLGRPGTPILRDPTVQNDADYVVCESTYGGREHEPETEAVRMLAEAVRATSDAAGVLLIPSFAIGRTQEIVWELDRMIDRGEIPLLPLYLDSPMASKASDIYRRHPEFYDAETSKLLKEGDTPLDYPKQEMTRSAQASKAIATAQRPYMIVASNGMLTGGRVVNHLRNLIGDPTPRSCSSATRARARSVRTSRPAPGRSASTGSRARSSAASARSAASRRTPTSRSCSTGCATSRPASRPGPPAIRAPSSSSTATRGAARHRAKGRSAWVQGAHPTLARGRHARLSVRPADRHGHTGPRCAPA